MASQAKSISPIDIFNFRYLRGRWIALLHQQVFIKIAFQILYAHGISRGPNLDLSAGYSRVR